MLTNEEIIMCQMMDRLLEAKNEEEKKIIKEKIKLIQKITKIQSQIYLLYYKERNHTIIYMILHHSIGAINHIYT